MIKDRFGRPIKSLRISVTRRCNLNCIYCHKEGTLPTNYEMSKEEIYRICKVAKEFDINKVKITGGEPLIRKDIVEIISALNSLNFKDISMTTNGVYLKNYAYKLKKAGLDRINVSLDSLKNHIYKSITGKDFLDKVKEGISKAIEAGLHPVKINMLILKDINENEVWDLFEFCKEHGAILQIIELVKIDDNSDYFEKYYKSLDSIEEEIRKKAEKVMERKFMHGRKKYFIDGSEIEIVRPMDNSVFCANCTRLRITPDAKIKPCLLRNDNLVDLKPALKCKSNYMLKKLFIEAIHRRSPYFGKYKYVV
ncbi:GTP cyclohydrolase subunit MoaA [Methanothermus fervidus DSM 2088]|uniref:Probable GTP 3',8-cyclase n=1 Tax=Methanothermus fervidus (strain ATCC 43054 / DSM 2088 / JCM 10308 / V24 S) TaxID=523846 RepID=E3GWI1_METFV|nr:GTP 3',8-cyclase MoaA [Methanothermus fervidus]ADP77946.1 GTP cyclohydrolase subunit MoaA [Methanothermus fervidus DSM 2088]